MIFGWIWIQDTSLALLARLLRFVHESWGTILYVFVGRRGVMEGILGELCGGASC